MGHTRKQLRDHLVAIAAEGITVKAYAQREGVSLSALYDERRRERTQRSRSADVRGSRFIAVQVAPSPAADGCQVLIGEQVRLQLAQLPTPDWIARLVRDLAREARS